MNIKTALTLGSGIVIGFFAFGDYEEKERIADWARKKLLYLLGGEEKKDPATRYSPTTFSTSKPMNERDTYVKKIKYGLAFKTQEKAEKVLQMIKNYDYLTISVHTVFMMKSDHVDYTWDAYGWDIKDFQKETVCVRDIADPELLKMEYKYEIGPVPKPHVIDLYETVEKED